MTTREQKEGQAGRGRSTADPGGRHLWRATLIFRLVTMVVGMAYTLVIGPLFEHSTGRWIVADAWVALRGALYVGNGALGYLYESTNIFVATPLLPIVLASMIFAEQ